jgi:ribosomal protein L19E
MSLKTVRRLAARLLRAGESRIRIIDAKRASEALTGDDVRSLIAEGVIALEPPRGVRRVSRRRARTLAGGGARGARKEG